MKKALFFPLQVSLCTVGYLYASGSITQESFAQIVPDGTTDTTVNTENGNFTIEQGDRAGNNLFHSFGDFSVPTDGLAFFDNATDISNIFSTVTGGNISNIDGLIRANGSANLFLMNPAGILFGNNARLDIGGSFYGSTASSILFEDGEFSAVDNLEQPVLTVNAPIGLGFRDNPGEIVNRSFAQNSADEFVGLEVLSGQTLALIGGDVRFEAGEATVKGGNIEIGGLSEAGIVSFNENGSLRFPDDVARANLLFENAADLDVRGTGGGNITVNANNLQLTDGEFGGSLIRAGITSDSTSANAQAGDILVNSTGDITLNNIRILNQVDLGGVGNSGDITINTNSLAVINGGNISASTFGQGNAGLVDIIATENINLDGVDFSGFPSGVTSFVGQEAEGDAGNINIETSNLVLTNGSSITSSTFGLGNSGAVSISTDNLSLFDGGQINASVLGLGNGGDITINTSDNILIDGDSANGFGSGIFSQFFPEGVGNGGDIDITTSNLVLTNGSSIVASTFGLGNAGEIIITTNNLTLIDGGQISASTFGDGDGGDVNINTMETITIRGFTENNSSGLFANALVNNGNGGNINLVTNQLVIDDGGIITASNFDNSNISEPGTGDAGNIFIEANSIDLVSNASIDAATQSSTGRGGNITLEIAENIFLVSNSSISAQAFGNADGGNIEIDTRFLVAFPNNNNEILANAEAGFRGSINITAEAIFGFSSESSNPQDPQDSTNTISASSEFNEIVESSPEVVYIDTSTTIIPIDSQQTIAETCNTNRLVTAQSSFTIQGRGGIPNEPGLPLDSQNIFINGETNPTSAIPQPIETSQGEIQPARGIKVTKDGGIVLTAYRTNNSGDRIPDNSPNCG